MGQTHAIRKAQWADTRHTCLLLDVADNETGEEFAYAARGGDGAPLNMELWEQAMQNPGAILEDETTLVLTGEKPLPEGHTVIGNMVYSDARQAALVRGKVSEALAALASPEAAARAELDEEYAAERREKMRKLLAVEGQEGFPYDVDWSGAL